MIWRRAGHALLLLAGMFDWQPGFPAGARLHFCAGDGPAPEADLPLEGAARTLCLLAEPDGRIFAGGAALFTSVSGLLTSDVCCDAYRRPVIGLLGGLLHTRIYTCRSSCTARQHDAPGC